MVIAKPAGPAPRWKPVSAAGMLGGALRSEIFSGAHSSDIC
jgi:hypothetical protein